MLLKNHVLDEVKMGPTTPYGKMLKALAKRDERVARYWFDLADSDERERDNFPSMLYYPFAQAVERRFRPVSDPSEVMRFLLAPRTLLQPERPLPLLESEALIRSALGERGLIDNISLETIGEVRAALFVYLVEDMGLSSEDVDALLVNAERWVVEDREGSGRPGAKP